jgi:hypothetical protein
VAADADPATAHELHRLVPGLLDDVQPAGTGPDDPAAAMLHPAGGGPGLLDGAAGVALSVLATTVAPPRSGWDTCLLLT